MGELWSRLKGLLQKDKTMATVTQAQIDQITQKTAQQQMAKISISDPYLTTTSSGGLTTSGNLTIGSGTWGSSGITSGYANTQRSPCWKSADDNWGDAENQEAAGYGWMLISVPSPTPKLTALFFGTKTSMSDEEILQDVVTHAMTGECRIAYKMLSILSQNRSPYAEWDDTVKVLRESY